MKEQNKVAIDGLALMKKLLPSRQPILIKTKTLFVNYVVPLCSQASAHSESSHSGMYAYIYTRTPFAVYTQGY